MMPDTHSDAPSGSGFPGFGEGAPLDLSGLTPAAESALVDRIRDGSFDGWTETASRLNFCTHPVRLTGGSVTIDAITGEVRGSFSSAETSLGVLYRPCGNRRAEVCPPCSRTYARDFYEMMHRGIMGGRTIPEGVRDNPLLFVTFTAPSFGHVHGPRPKNGQKTGGRCRPRDKTAVCAHGRHLGCMQVHGEDDPANGAPLCWDCYAWETAVVWQYWAPELWRRTTLAEAREP